MATTANTLITRALQLLGVIAAGELPTADDSADCLVTLNDMVSAWALEPLTIYAQTRLTKTLSPAVQSYTIGSGAAIDVARPLWVTNAGVIPSGQTSEIPIDMLTEDMWANTLIKSQTSTFPTGVYYDYGFNSSGYGTMTVWPVPTTAPTLVLYLPQAITSFADGTTSYTFPPGYERMLRYNLAVELAPEYGRPLDAALAGLAISSKANVKRANYRPSELKVDSALLPNDGRRGSYNWRVDK